MGRFFNDKVGTKKLEFNKLGLIIVGVVFLIVLLLIVGSYNRKQTKNSTPNYRIYNKVAMDIGGELPNVEDYFESIDNDDYSKVSVDTSKVDPNTAGTYTVVVTIGRNEELVQITVGDASAPKLELQELTIKKGDSYNIEDFVKSCKDNSGEDCILSYGTIFDKDGKELDPSKITEVGTYEIKIFASDNSKNTTEAIVTKLIISESTSTGGTTDIKPPVKVECEYGTLSYDKTEYPNPIAVIVGNTTTNCALPYTQWDKDDTLKAANEVAKNDVSKMQNQVSSNNIFINTYPEGSTPVVYIDALSIINNDSKGDLGLVGYSINVKVQINNDTILDYYINADGSRTYSVNKLGIE